MRIFYVGRNASIGGGSTFRLNIGRGLRARGHHVAISALGGPMVRRYQEAGLRFHSIPPFRVCAGLLARAISAERAELVHASNTTAGDTALLASRRAGLPLVVSLHNTISPTESRHECLKQADQILVFDSGAEASARSYHQEFDPGKILRLPRPVEHRPADAARISPLHVSYVARLSSRKGRVALALVNAFETFARENPGARLTIVGDGSMHREVARRSAEVARNSGGTVDVRGRSLDPGAVLQSTGILVGAGYAALEAVMQGRAVIGAGFKGFGALSGENVLEAVEANFGDTVGVDIDDITPEWFLEALRRLRAAWEQPETRALYWGLDRVLAPIHSIDHVAGRLEAIYAEVLARR